jgi:addiction module HigA family antidote
MKQQSAIRYKDRPPTHPGEILREDVFPALGLSTAALADNLGVTRQALHSVLREKAAVSPEMAIRLGKLLGNGPQLWLRMQEAVDLWNAERKLAEQIDKIRTLRAA